MWLLRDVLSGPGLFLGPKLQPFSLGFLHALLNPRFLSLQEGRDSLKVPQERQQYHLDQRIAAFLFQNLGRKVIPLGIGF